MRLNSKKSLARNVFKAIKPLRRHLYNRYLNRDSEDIIIIASIPRSGTTFLRYILTNYLRLLQSPDAAPVTYQEMHRQLFPNRKAYDSGANYRPPSAVMDVVEYRDIYNTHKIVSCLAHSRANIIFLYRNPLDNLVSRYYYMYKYRPSKRSKARSAKESADLELPKFIRDYNLIKYICRRKERAFAIAYESLVRAPYDTARDLLNWLNIPVRTELLRKALEYSSLERIREEEERVGPIGAPKDFEGFFTRSGKIGQWKEHFSPDEVENIKTMLEKSGICLDDFVLR